MAGGVRAEPDAVAEDVGREVLDVFRVDLGPVAHEQRPDLGEPAPADDRARRGAEIDAVLDQLGRRVDEPVGVRVVRAASPPPAAGCTSPSRSCRNTCSLIDAAQLDDALLRHQLRSAARCLKSKLTSFASSSGGR